MLRTFPIGRHRIPVAINASIALAQLALILACFWAASRVVAGWPMALLAVGFGVLMNSVYSVIHEAEHAMLFRPYSRSFSTGRVSRSKSA